MLPFICVAAIFISSSQLSWCLGALARTIDFFSILLFPQLHAQFFFPHDENGNEQ